MSDPATLAVQDQVGALYRADVWLNVKLEAMTKVWQGIGGHSNFFVSEHDAREARGAYVGMKPFKFAETLWRLAQVRPSATHGYRTGIREFVVDRDVIAACSVCASNVAFGSGSVFQYFIPGWEDFLYSTGRTYTFFGKSYS